MVRKSLYILHWWWGQEKSVSDCLWTELGLYSCLLSHLEASLLHLKPKPESHYYSKTDPILQLENKSLHYFLVILKTKVLPVDAIRIEQGITARLNNLFFSCFPGSFWEVTEASAHLHTVLPYSTISRCQWYWPQQGSFRTWWVSGAFGVRGSISEIWAPRIMSRKI